MKQFVFVAGGGKYGSLALRHLANSRVTTVICDREKDCQATNYVGSGTNAEGMKRLPNRGEPNLLIGDAAEALTRLLESGIVPRLIVPCVPFHFAARVLTIYLTRKGLQVAPDFAPLKSAFGKAKLKDIEYRLYGENALAVASKMPFDSICRDGCAQPEKCPITGRTLAMPMFEIMKETLGRTEADIIKILRSRLIAPNVGGFPGLELKRTLDLCIKKSPCTMALATSCACHAVANLFSVSGHGTPLI